MPGPPTGKSDVILITFGVCVWDYLTSLWFEHALISRKIRFRWQFVPYFLARYTALAFAIVNLVDIFTDSPGRPPCSHTVIVNTALHLGLISVVFATWNLLTRTAIIWAYHPLLMKILFVTGLAHFALAFVAASVGHGMCAGQPSLFGVMVFGSTTAVIEFVILLLSLIGIKRACANGESRLARTLRAQGIAYFVIVLFIQISTIAVTLAHTDDPTRMGVGISGAILSPILSCRLVTSTISQGGYEDYDPNSRLRRLECFELSEDQSRNQSAGRMTTCIDIETAKDQSVC